MYRYEYLCYIFEELGSKLVLGTETHMLEGKVLINEDWGLIMSFGLEMSAGAVLLREDVTDGA